MKKTSILIAMFAVIAATSAAQAEINMDFDGKLKPQSMHDIFSGSHQIIPQEALAQVPVPAPVDPEESPIPMIEPWQIDPNGYCMMIPWTDEDGVYHDCSPLPNTGPGYCEQVEIAPGVHFPLCFIGDAVVAYKADPAIAHKISTGFKQSYTGYSTNPRFASVLTEIAKDKTAKILYNGKKFSLAKRRAGRWHSDESLAAHSDYTENHPETQGHIEVAYPGNTLTGAVAGATSGNLGGTLIGAVIGFWQDVNDYANNN